MIERVKTTLPLKIRIIENNTVEPIPQDIVDDTEYSITLSPKQHQKLQLILEIKEHFKSGIPIRQIAQYYSMSRNTVRKYIQLEDPETRLLHTSRRETINFLDTISKKIDSLCQECSTMTEMTNILHTKYGDYVTYSKLVRYMKKHNLKPLKKEVREQAIKCKLESKGIEISRTKIIKYIFSWKNKKEDEDLILANIKTITMQYPIVSIFKDFYTLFKTLLIESKYKELVKILGTTYEDITLNKYIKSLNTDYKAVLHAAQYTYSNGVTEGNVNKLKKIKRDMYNRASIKLLRNKVIFQSLSF